ncbi:MAG: glycosyltransferase [Candidatus Berkelbacteria bacterium]|nr:glycosyltransferase [Candidatus Berkelbacteria bacterium]MCR4306956.1 glycosyltransferase [Candidatus Berkelbacteria bacterium]
MRVLIGTLSYKPNVSGVAVGVDLLTQYLIEHGHQVFIVAPSRSLRSYVEHQDNLTIYRVRSIPNPARRGFYLPVFTGRITEKIFREVKPDIVHVHDPMAMSRYLQKSATNHGVPTVASNHFMLDYVGAYLPRPIRSMVLSWLRRKYVKFYNQCQAVIAPSYTTVDYLRGLGVKVPLCALSNGVDIERFFAYIPLEQTRKAYNLPNMPIILYLGRLDKDKSLNILIDAFAQVRAQIPCHLLLVGGGDKQLSLARQIDKRGLSQWATLTGLIPHHSLDLVALYQVADIYVIASMETQSITTLEALAAGKPVVAANWGALPELIHDGQNGLLFEAGSSTDLATKIKKLLDDSDLRAQLSIAAIQTATEHELRKSLQLFEDLYVQLLAH